MNVSISLPNAARSVALGTLFALSGCAAPADPQVLMDADRAFNDAVRREGSSAWVTWFTEDGAIVREGVGEIRGRENMRQAVMFLDDPQVSLTWDPERAEIARSGDLGWTTGSFEVETTAPDGSITRGTGIYVSIWRLQPNGEWKVVMDLGNPI